MRINISFGFDDGCCIGCTGRCVEPLCRTNCEAWQKHEARKHQVYAMRAVRRDAELDTADSIERHIGHKLSMR